jgi:hypothetical protein
VQEKKVEKKLVEADLCSVKGGSLDQPRGRPCNHSIKWQYLLVQSYQADWLTKRREQRLFRLFWKFLVRLEGAVLIGGRTSVF